MKGQWESWMQPSILDPTIRIFKPRFQLTLLSLKCRKLRAMKVQNCKLVELNQWSASIQIHITQMKRLSRPLLMMRLSWGYVKFLTNFLSTTFLVKSSKTSEIPTSHSQDLHQKTNCNNKSLKMLWVTVAFTTATRLIRAFMKATTHNTQSAAKIMSWSWIQTWPNATPVGALRLKKTSLLKL